MLCAACGREIMSGAVYCPYCETRVEGAVEPDDYVYEAFISYRHLQNDRRLAIRIQRSLEGAVIPRELRKKSGRKRLDKFFRDEDELSTTASLSNTIVDALKKSRFLIVICSPQTRESEWVLREVETFASLHGRDRILIALAAGEPYESFPPLLLSHLEWDDDSEAYVAVKSEPLAANFRDRSFGNFRREVLRLESSILGCAYDDLLQRVRMRRLRMNVAVSAVLMVGAVIFGLVVLGEKFLIEMSFTLSQMNESKLLAREARDYLEGGNRIESLRASLTALAGSSWEEESRPFVATAQYSLETALGVFPKLSPWTGLYSIEGVGSLCDNHNGVQALVEQGNYVVVSEVVSGKRLMVIVPPTSGSVTKREAIELRSVKLGQSKLLCAYGNSLSAYDYRKGVEVWSAAGPDTLLPYAVAYLEKSKQFMVFYQGLSKDNASNAPIIRFYDEETGKVVRSIELAGLTSMGEQPRIVISADESTVAFTMTPLVASGNSSVIRFDVDQIDADNTAYYKTDLSNPYVSDLSFVGDSVVVVTHTVNDDYTIKSYSFECFDASLVRQWVYDGSLPTVFDDDGNALRTSASVVGPVSVREEGTPDIYCVCGSWLVTLDGRTGERLDSESMGEPIVDAFLVSPPGEPVTIAGCTVGGSVFLRTPAVNSVKKDKLNKESFGAEIYDVQMIEDEKGFLGLAVWSYNPISYHVYTVSDLRRINSLPHVPDASSSTYTYGSHGEVLLCVKDEELCSIDPNTFETAWRCPLASMDLADNGGLHTIIAGKSVLVLNAKVSREDVEDGCLPVYELSLEDGSLIAKHLLPLGDVSNYLALSATSLNTQYCKTKDGGRLLVIGGIGSVSVCDLDNDSLVYELSDDDAYFVSGVWLGKETIGVRYFQNYCYISLYSLETGEPIQGEIADYSIDTNDTAAICIGGEDNNLLTACCQDGFLRCFSMTDGSLMWCGPVETRNVLFVCDIGGNKLLTQDSSGRASLVDANNGSLVASSEVRLFPMKDCVRKDEGSGTAVLMYTLPGIYEGTGLIEFEFNNTYTFGPLSETNYGFFLSQDKKHVLAKTPWSDECVLYPRYTLDEMVAEAKTLVSSFDVLDEYVDLEYGQNEQGQEDRSQ